MDMLILGLLMQKRLTAYELQGIIKRFFQCMCSDSLGSIRAALKKLLDMQLIACSEYVERSVNKKQYSITDAGREEYMKWLHIPADLTAPKNIELSKLYGLGLLTAEERKKTLNEIIATLENKLSEFLAIKASIDKDASINEMLVYWENNLELKEGILKSAKSTSFTQAVEQMAAFQMLTLQYSIDMGKFQVEWFMNVKNNLNNLR